MATCKKISHYLIPTVWNVCTTHKFSSVQSLSRVRLFATPWITAHQVSLSINNSRTLLKLMSIESVMPSNHLLLCRPLLLLPSIFPNIRVFSNESALRIRWLKYWSFSFNISLSNEHPGLISFRMDWLDSLQSKGISRVFSNTKVQKHWVKLLRFQGLLTVGAAFWEICMQVRKQQLELDMEQQTGSK